MQVQMETAVKITKATCTLHNWLRMSCPISYTLPGSIDYEDISLHLSFKGSGEQILQNWKVCADPERIKGQTQSLKS